MEEILAMCGSEQLAGFVLPKIDLYTLPKYEALINQRPHLRVMLTIETKLAFRRLELERLRTLVEQLSCVLCIRFGANDLLGAWVSRGIAV